MNKGALLRPAELVELGHRLTERRVEQLDIRRPIEDARLIMREGYNAVLYTAERLGVSEKAVRSAFLPAGEHAAFRFSRSDPKVWGGRGHHERPEQLSVRTGESQIAPVRHGRAIVLDRGEIFVFQDPHPERVYRAWSTATKEAIGYTGPPEEFWTQTGVLQRG